MRPIHLLLLVSTASAWSGNSYTNGNIKQQQLQQQQQQQYQQIESSTSRRNFFGIVAGVSTVAVIGLVEQQQQLIQPAFAADDVDTGVTRKSDPPGTVVNLPNGVSYTVIKQGSGPAPDIGELCAIRFVAYAGEMKIDDITDTPEPYYTRVGSGGLIKGVETTLPLMQLGDRWKITVPGNLAFGEKGRPASAGRPRIPGNAIVTFEVEMVGLPGKEPELIELIGDF